MKYTACDSEGRTTKAFEGTLLAAAITVAIVIAVDGLGTIFDVAFYSVSPLLETACTRFC